MNSANSLRLYPLRLERARTSLANLETRLAEKETERAAYADLVSRAKEIESAYKAWQKARKGLEELDQGGNGIPRAP